MQPTTAATSTSTPSPGWILSPTKPPPASSHPSILALEVFVDEMPTLRGGREDSAGTDLSGTVSLALSDALPEADRIVIQLYGAATKDHVASSAAAHPNLKSAYERQAPGGLTMAAPSSSSTSPSMTASNIDDGELVYCSSHDLWSATRTSSPLIPGAHDLRFMFKIPGTTIETAPGKCRYVLRCQVLTASEGPTALAHARVLAAMVEEVRIRRVGLDGGAAESELELPAYDFPVGVDAPPPPDFDFGPPPPIDVGAGAGGPPGYQTEWKGKAVLK